jgi:hypothetical protein
VWVLTKFFLLGITAQSVRAFNKTRPNSPGFFTQKTAMPGPCTLCCGHKKTATKVAVRISGGRFGGKGKRSLLPRTLLMAIRLQALPALVLVHLQTTFLFEIAHK